VVPEPVVASNVAPAALLAVVPVAPVLVADQAAVLAVAPVLVADLVAVPVAVAGPVVAAVPVHRVSARVARSVVVVTSRSSGRRRHRS